MKKNKKTAHDGTLAGGMTPQEILDDYPGIEEADIRACIAYGAEMSRGHLVDVVPGEPGQTRRG
jgi:hypothetical protein